MQKNGLSEYKPFAGFASLELELDVNRNEEIFETLLGLEPDDVIAKVIGELRSTRPPHMRNVCYAPNLLFPRL